MRRGLSRLLLFVVCISIGIPVVTCLGQDSNSENKKRTTMIDKEYRHLSFQEQQHFVARLKKRRDVESLRAIIELKLDVRCAAMCALIELLSPEDALAYCKQLETSDKAAWVTAFACLPCHPKKTILPYILSKAKSTDPRLRCLW